MTWVPGPSVNRWRISKLDLFKPALVSPYIDLIVVIPEIYLTLTQDLPPAWCLCRGSQSNTSNRSHSVHSATFITAAFR